MQIDFTAKALEKPLDMPLKADLMWRYLDINNGGWSAAEVGCISVILTDESNDFGCCSYVFTTVTEFIKWLSDVADEHLYDDPADFLTKSDMIDPLIASDAVIAAIMDTLNEEENNK